jgi:spore germination protein KB
MLFILIIPELNLENIQPFLGEGIKSIIKGTYHNFGLPFLELIIFLMITPYVNEKAKTTKAYYRRTLIGGPYLSF